MPFVTDIKPDHFIPTLKWPKTYHELYQTKYTDQNGEHTGFLPKWLLVDPTTNLLFLSDSRNIVRYKFLVLALILAPLVHVILATIQTIFNLLNIIFDFGKMIYDGKKSFKKNFSKLLYDIFKLLLTPLLVVALEITAIFGLLFPLNARKIFGSTERLMTRSLEVHFFYNKICAQNTSNYQGSKGISALCFQPKVKNSGDSE